MIGNIVDAGMAALSVLGAQSQANRLMRMDFPQADGPANAVMLVNKVRMREELSRDFRIEAEVLSDDAGITLKSMMGRMVTISLVRENGSLRYMNGYVGTFRFVRTDGGFAYYQMLLSPWLAFARLRQDNVSFHHRSTIELTETTFGHYRQRDWKARLGPGYDDKKLTCANQHNETDYNHLHRRWEDAGLYYHYEHRADGHTLILSDNSTLAEPIDDAHVADAADQMPFRAQAGSEEADGIDDWQAVRELGSGKLTLASFNYKSPHPQRVQGSSLNAQGDVDGYELYENTGAYGYPNLRDGETLAQRRMEEHDQRTQYFEAGGNDRAAQPGRHVQAEAATSARKSRRRRQVKTGNRVSARATISSSRLNMSRATIIPPVRMANRNTATPSSACAATYAGARGVSITACRVAIPACRRPSSSARPARIFIPTRWPGSNCNFTGTGWAHSTRPAHRGYASCCPWPASTSARCACRASARKCWCSSSMEISTIPSSSASSTTATTCRPGICRHNARWPDCAAAN